MSKRNAIEISVKGLILAVVVIIALALSAISLFMVTRSKSTINDGNTQYSRLMSDYSEISATLYDGLYVSGDKVVDVIKDCSKELANGVTVATLLNTKGVRYDNTNQFSDKKYSRSDNDYINPAGTFVGSVSKNNNGIVVGITFTQTN